MVRRLVTWLAMAVLLHTVLPGTARAGALGEVTWRNPLPYGLSFRKIAFGNGRFVAWAGPNTILTSVDGVDWTERTVNVERSGDGDLGFGAGRFVLVSGTGALTSADGATWEPVPVSDSASEQLQSVAYGSGLFVAAGLEGLYTSVDGLAWSRTPSSDPPYWQRVIYAGRFFVWSRTGVLATSEDGLAWTRISLESGGQRAHIYHVQYDGARFAAFGLLPKQGIDPGFDISPAPQVAFLSADGQTWHLTDERIVPLESVTQGAGVYTAVEMRSHTLMTSIAGAGWATTWFPSSDQSAWRCGAPASGTLAYGNGILVAGGRCGLLLTSPDGLTWTVRSSAATYADLKDVLFAAGIWVAGGDSGLLTSPDGISWTTVPGTRAYAVRRIAYGKGRFVAVADNVLLTSTDGVTWKVAETHGATLFEVVFADGRFVAGGAFGTVMTSPDGEVWERHTYPYEQPVDHFAYGDGAWLRIDDYGTVFRSETGATWSVAPGGSVSGTNNPQHVPISVVGDVTSVAYGSPGFVASARAGLFYSSDGLSWDRVFAVNGGFNRVIYTDGWFLALGGFRAALSLDGRHWVEVPLPLAEPRGAAIAPDGFIVVGESGSIVKLYWPARVRLFFAGVPSQVHFPRFEHQVMPEALLTLGFDHAEPRLPVDVPGRQQDAVGP